MENGHIIIEIGDSQAVVKVDMDAIFGISIIIFFLLSLYYHLYFLMTIFISYGFSLLMDLIVKLFTELYINNNYKIILIEKGKNGE